MKSAHQSLALLTVTLLSLASVAGAAPISNQQQSVAPNVTVTVEGTQLSSNESVTVTRNPSVTANVTATVPIETLTIMVDGQQRLSITPNESTALETLRLDLSDGRHTITVTAATNETTTVAGTLLKDTAQPYISYTSPFQTSSRGPPTTVALENASVDLAGQLSDTTGVKEVRIDWEYEYQFAGRSRATRERYRIPEPGRSFTQPLLLGVGDNEVTIVATDRLGNTRRHETTLELDDTQAPSVTIQRAERINNGSQVRVSGTVQDNVQVNSLFLSIGGQFTTVSQRTVVSASTKEPDPTRQQIEFDETFDATGDATRLRYNATDVAENANAGATGIQSARSAVPTIRIDEASVNSSGDRIRLTGSVSEGRVTRVVAATRGKEAMTDRVVVYDGPVTGTVTVDTELRVGRSDTKAIIRATDSTGTVHTESAPLPRTEPETETATEVRRTQPPSSATAAPATTVPETSVTQSPTVVGKTDAPGAGFGIGPVLLAVCVLCLGCWFASRE